MRLASLALPHHQHPKASFMKLMDGSAVTFHVPGELRFPECSVSFGCGRSLAALMPVPEAAVDEHGPSTRPIGDVGASREVAVPDPIPSA
jgi:hypothetical protein